MRIQIDASAHCQLACPSCPTASGLTHKFMKAGHLQPEAWQALLDANPAIREVELSNYGEMFLNPKLAELLRIAFEREVVIHADNGVNFNHSTPEMIEALVRYRVASMTVSIDGASAESYAKYRQKGDFERVIAHIGELNRIQQERGSVFPLLTWQFIVFGHNEDEIEAARAMARELGMAFKPKISWDDDFSPVRNPGLVQLRTGMPATRQEFRRAHGVDYARGICYQLWMAPVLNWDGRLMGCCRNFWGDFGGNAFEEGLEAVLQSERIRKARQALMGRAPMDPEIPCAGCELFLAMQRDGKWITAEEIPRPETWTLAGMIPRAGDLEVTHADIFVAPGHEVNRLLLARPPGAHRVVLGRDIGAVFRLRPGDYTIYAYPKKLDPAYRIQYPPIPAVAVPIVVKAKPAAQQFEIALADAQRRPAMR